MGKDKQMKNLIDAEEIGKITRQLVLTKGLVVVNPTSSEAGPTLPDTEALIGTVADPSGSWMVAEVSGKTFNIKPITPTWEKALLNGVEHWAFRIGNTYAALINKLIGTTGTVYSASFKRALADEISRFFDSTLRSATMEGPGLMWAWGNFSACQDGEVGLDIEVANKLLKLLVASQGVKFKPTGNTVLRNGVEIPADGKLLEGAELMVIRHPTSPANSSDTLKIRVFDCKAPFVGVNQKTAESRLGDFDHDLCMGSFGEKIAPVKGAIDKIVNNLGDENFCWALTSPYVEFSPKQGDLTLQSVFWNGHFDREDTGFSTLVGGEAKKAVGLFKQVFFWGFEGLLISKASREQILDVAKTILSGDKVDEANKAAVEVRYRDCQQKPESRAYLNRLAQACLYSTTYGLEEILMDSAKQKVDPVEMVSKPESTINALQVITDAISTGSVNYEELEAEGFETCVLKLAVSLGFVVMTDPETGEDYVGFNLNKALQEANPAYWNLVSNKKQWLVNKKWEDNLSLLDIPLSGYVKAFIDGGHAEVLTGVIPVNTKLSSSEETFPYSINNEATLDWHRDITERCPISVTFDKDENGESYLSVSSSLNVMEPDWGYKLYPLEEGNKGCVIVSPSGSKYFGGTRVYITQYHPYPTWSGYGQADFVAKNGAPYPNTKLNMVKVPIWQELQMIGAEAYKKAVYRGRTGTQAEIDLFKLNCAHKAVRNAITSLPLVEDSVGAEYLGQFVTLNIPPMRKKGVDWQLDYTRHSWRQLEALGFDPRATAHAKRGERLAQTSSTGESFLQEILGFGQVTNKNRISKMDSTLVKHRMFDNVQEVFTTPVKRKLPIMKEVCVALVNWEGFGANPADETYRTLDGDVSLSTSIITWKQVDMDTFYTWLEEETDEDLKTKALKKSTIVRVSSEIEVPKFFIPSEKPGVVRDARKVTLGIRPGVSQPIELRLIATFKPLTENQCKAKEWQKRLKETGNKRAMVIDIVDNEKALLKKEAFDQLLRMVNSQLDMPVDPTEYSPQGIISKDRATKAFKNYKGLGEVVEFNEFDDLVSEIERRLVAEKKSHEGLMYLYQVQEDGSVAPLMDGATHVRAVVGMTTVMRSVYEDGWGSYGKVSMNLVSLDPHLRLLSGEGFNYLNGTHRLTYTKLWENVQATEELSGREKASR